MEKIDFDTSSSIRTRKAFITKALFENFISLTVSGSLLAKLLLTLEVSDSLNGIINSVATFACLIQFVSLFLANKKINVKLVVITSQTISILLFTFLFAIPFLPISKDGKIVIFTISIIIANFLREVFKPIFFKWWTSFVHPQHRGSFSALNYRISMITGNIIYITALSFIIDEFDNSNNIRGAFLFVIIISSIFNLCHFISVMNMKNCSIISEQNQNMPFKMIIKNTLFNKTLLSIFIMRCLFGFSTSFITGFISVYSIKELDMSLFLIQVIIMGATVLGVIIIKPFGKLADKTSCIKVVKIGYIYLLISYVALVFTTPATWYLIIVYHLMSRVAESAYGPLMEIMYYSYIEKDYIPQTYTISSIILGIVNFVAVILGGLLLEFIQKSNISFYGVHIYAQQVLCVISIIFILGALGIAHFVISKKEIKIQ